MALMSALKQIASIETGPVSKGLRTEIFKLVLGTLSLPINFPGTNYYRGLKVASSFWVLPFFTRIIRYKFIASGFLIGKEEGCKHVAWDYRAKKNLKMLLQWHSWSPPKDWSKLQSKTWWWTDHRSDDCLNLFWIWNCFNNFDDGC